VEEADMDVRIDVDELRGKVRGIYGGVAEQPEGPFHFETGRGLAEKLGYDRAQLDELPPEAVRSFAGVGHHLELAAIRPGERVLDLGSGSGMDSFLAARRAGEEGEVIGVDMTPQQLAKARALARRSGFDRVTFVEGFVEDLPVEDASVDVVISNGVINLAADKRSVFEEIARVLKPAGRMAISDIVTERPLTEEIKCDTSLWAACIGGAAQEDRYVELMEAVGLSVVRSRANPQYAFLSKSAQGATETFGVKSVSLLATRTA
jgi:arsenite methyltransferase